MRKIIILTLLVLIPVLASADYLEIKRSAKLKSEPRADSETIADIIPPKRVRIIGSGQENGYYHVEVPDSGQTGWVYRTLGRRYAGELDNQTSSIPTSTRATAFAGRIAAARRRSGEPCADDLASCPDYGCANPGSDHALLNQIKRNRRPVGPLVSLTFQQFRSLQSKVDHLRLPVGQGTELSEQDRKALQRLELGAGVTVGEGRYVQLVGYISPERKLRASGGESVNCRLTDVVSNDIHIPIVERSDGSEYESIVIEPTPQDRPPAWSVQTFKHLQEDGRLLMIRGQLLFDNQHRVHDDPDNEEGLQNEPKRFTTWEIHPVTDLLECGRSDNACNPGDLNQWQQIK